MAGKATFLIFFFYTQISPCLSLSLFIWFGLTFLLDRNLVDAANIAALAALSTFRRPECSLGEDGQEVIVHPPEVRTLNFCVCVASFFDDLWLAAFVKCCWENVLMDEVCGKKFVIWSIYVSKV